MTVQLLQGAKTVLTMDGSDLHGADVRIDNGVIIEVGRGLAVDGAEVHRVDGCVVSPGLVNTHHHLFQSLTRAVPRKTVVWSAFGIISSACARPAERQHSAGSKPIDKTRIV